MLDKIKEFGLKCIHRHTIEEHPNCFAEEKINIKQAEKIAKETGMPWYQVPGLKIGVLDIEADGLKADFSTMLTWSIKDLGGETHYDVVTKADLFSGDADKHIVESAVNKLKEYSIIIGYYSTKYDLPFIRTKALHYGLAFPEYGSLYHFDLYYTVKSKLCLSRNSLDNATNYLGISGKTPIDKEIWRTAKYGDPVSLREVLAHNIADVEITERLYQRLIPFRKWIKSSV